MRVNIYADPVNYTLSPSHLPQADFHIGLEQGAYEAFIKGVKLGVVLGDFDSLESSKLRELEAQGISIVRHPEEKDDSDTALAIQYALAMNADEIWVYGGIGSRFDHSYANALWCKKAPVTFITDVTKVYVLHPGRHALKPQHPVISFFALDAIDALTLTGFKYPLKAHPLSVENPLCLSNEGYGTVEFKEGTLMVVESNES